MSTPEAIIGHYIDVKGTRTFYDEIGEGKPLVCVHTAGASSLEYHLALPLYASQGFHVFALICLGTLGVILLIGPSIVAFISTRSLSMSLYWLSDCTLQLLQVALLGVT